MFQPHGGFAEYAIHEAATLTPHPNVPTVEAAATPCAAWTAYRSLVDNLRVQPGQSLLVIGGTAASALPSSLPRYLGMNPIIAACWPAISISCASLEQRMLIKHYHEQR